MPDEGESIAQMFETSEGSLAGSAITPMPFTGSDGSEGGKDLYFDGRQPLTTPFRPAVPAFGGRPAAHGDADAAAGSPAGLASGGVTKDEDLAVLSRALDQLA